MASIRQQMREIPSPMFSRLQNAFQAVAYVSEKGHVNLKTEQVTEKKKLNLQHKWGGGV